MPYAKSKHDFLIFLNEWGGTAVCFSARSVCNTSYEMSRFGYYFTWYAYYYIG